MGPSRGERGVAGQNLPSPLYQNGGSRGDLRMPVPAYTTGNNKSHLWQPVGTWTAKVVLIFCLCPFMNDYLDDF